MVSVLSMRQESGIEHRTMTRDFVVYESTGSDEHVRAPLMRFKII